MGSVTTAPASMAPTIARNAVFRADPERKSLFMIGVFPVGNHKAANSPLLNKQGACQRPDFVRARANARTFLGFSGLGGVRRAKQGVAGCKGSGCEFTERANFP